LLGGQALGLGDRQPLGLLLRSLVGGAASMKKTPQENGHDEPYCDQQQA